MAAEGPTDLPGEPGPGRQFDFWLGSWDLAWEDGTGTNEISAIIDGMVIHEQFDGRPGSPLRGISVSAWDSTIGRWRQTWVDSNGAYLDFIGSFEGGRMILERTTADGIRQRMVWFDIESDSLRWNWERASSDGSDWDVLWAVRYRRRDLPTDRRDLATDPVT